MSLMYVVVVVVVMTSYELLYHQVENSKVVLVRASVGQSDEIADLSTIRKRTLLSRNLCAPKDLPFFDCLAC